MEARKLRPCLGWCGGMIMSTRSLRLCEKCSKIKDDAYEKRVYYEGDQDDREEE